MSEYFETLCFCGHTHVPGVFFQGEEAAWGFMMPAETGIGFQLGTQKFICNVGSVGQPRDGDPRACYVLYDGTEIQFRRVEYDIEQTIEKIHRHEDFKGFDDFLAEVLREER